MQTDLINKIKNAIPYYLESTDTMEKAFYEDSLKEHLSKFFKNAFKKDVEFIIERRHNKNHELDEVCVLGLLQSRRVEGRVWYDLTTDIPKRYLISFAPDAHHVSADILCSLILYGILSYTVNEFNTRITRCILEVAKSNNLPEDSKELNQLVGVLYYTFGTRNTYYVPVKDFSSNSLLDIFSFISPEMYNVYAKFTKEKLGYGAMLSLSESDRVSKDGSTFRYYYLDDAEKINSQMVSDIMKQDVRTARMMYDLAVQGKLDQYLESTHSQSGIKVRLKDLLSFQPLDKTLKSSNFIKKYADDINESAAPILNEGLFWNRPVTTSEYRYKVNKILVSSDYIETEYDRTALLSDCYRLKDRLIKEVEKEEAKIEGIVNKKEEKVIRDKMEYLQGLIREVGEVEMKVVKFKIVPKKFGVFVEYPAGYNY